MDGVVHFFSAIWDWINSGVVDLLSDFVKWCMSWIVTAWIKMKLGALTWAWDVGKAVIQNLGVSQKVTEAMGFLSPEVAKALAFFKVPDAINMLMNAGITKFVLRIVGW